MIIGNCFTDPECTDGDVRLVRGEGENEGQVEFCSSGRWGLVCRDSWDINDATVACRQLGYSVEGKFLIWDICAALPGEEILTTNVVHTVDGGTQITRVSLPTDFLISLYQVDCNGTEATLAQCPHSDTGCLSPGAGVICPETAPHTMDSITTTSSLSETTHKESK